MPGHAQRLRSTDLIGSWELLAYELVDRNGAVTRPFGDDPVGFLTYTDDDWMWVAFGRRNRPNFASDDLFGGSTDEKARAMDEFACYCGRYSVGSSYVVHYPKMSLYPNRIGTRQKRHAELDGQRLVLTTPPLPLSGDERQARLTLRRLRKANRDRRHLLAAAVGASSSPPKSR